MSGSIINLGDCLRLPARQDRMAYVDLRDANDVKRVTARELDALIRAFARALVDRAVGPGIRVAIMAENRIEFVVSYLAIMRVGAIAVPINFKLARETIAHIWRDSACRLAIVDSSRRLLLPADIAVIDMDESGPKGFDAILDPGPLNTFQPYADDLAELLYTSGSTGMPKGVPLTHSGQLWAIKKYLTPIAQGEDLGVTPIAAPLYHMNGLFFTTVSLANRMTIVSLPNFDAESYLQTVADYRCTYLTGVPSMFALAARAIHRPPPEALSHVTGIKLGSAPLTQALIDQVQQLFPNAEIANGYGTTEAGPAVFGPHPDGLPQPPTSIGYPLDDVEWRFANGSQEEGELEIRTPALTQGYLNRPEATDTKFIDDWYKTGDVMRRDGNGFFYFVSRTDDMFVCGGENVYPGEIETLLETHPKVAQAAVVSVPDEVKGAIPVAFIVPDGAATLITEQQLKTFTLENGPAYAHPRFVIIKNALPVGGTHKLDRSALIREAETHAKAAGRL